MREIILLYYYNMSGSYTSTAKATHPRNPPKPVDYLTFGGGLSNRMELSPEKVGQHLTPKISSRPQIQDIEGYEQGFRNWADQTLAKSTQDQYWRNIRDAPILSLSLKRNGEYIDDYADILGTCLDRVQTSAELNAHLKWIKYIHHLEENWVQGRETVQVLEKKKRILNTLEIPDSERDNKQDKIDRIKKNYVPKDALIRALRQAQPERARFWYVLYAGGFRIGEIKALDRSFLKEPGEDGYQFGGIYIPNQRTKSKSARTVEFLSQLPFELLKDAPVGSYEDDTGEEYQDVFFPDRDRKREQYKMGHKKYGIFPQIGIGGRSPHSLRHTRVTDLMFDEEIERDATWVRTRTGHESMATTNYYTETDYQVKPRTLENYCRQKDIDLRKAIEEEAQ